MERRNRSFDLYADSRLDEATYREQSARLDREIKELKDELARLEPDHLHVPELLGFAETVVEHAARAWADADLDQRQRLQAAIFPDGVVYAHGDIGTAKTSLFFGRLATGELKKESLVGRLGIEPRTT